MRQNVTELYMFFMKGATNRPKICTRQIISSQINFTHVEEQGQFISWMQYFVTGQETLKCWSLIDL